MSKEEIYKEAHKMLFEQSGNLDREEYKQLLYEIIDACRSMLNAMEEDNQNE